MRQSLSAGPMGWGGVGAVSWKAVGSQCPTQDRRTAQGATDLAGRPDPSPSKAASPQGLTALHCGCGLCPLSGFSPSLQLHFLSSQCSGGTYRDTAFHRQDWSRACPQPHPEPGALHLALHSTCFFLPCPHPFLWPRGPGGLLEPPHHQAWPCPTSTSL